MHVYFLLHDKALSNQHRYPRFYKYLITKITMSNGTRLLQNKNHKQIMCSCIHLIHSNSHQTKCFNNASTYNTIQHPCIFKQKLQANYILYIHFNSQHLTPNTKLNTLTMHQHLPQYIIYACLSRW